MIPVECARAFGGVEIGRLMARDAHIATPTMRLTALGTYQKAKAYEIFQQVFHNSVKFM